MASTTDITRSCADEEIAIDFYPFLCYDNLRIIKHGKGYFHGKYV